jgi:hypothetical protein
VRPALSGPTHAALAASLQSVFTVTAVVAVAGVARAVALRERPLRTRQAGADRQAERTA